MDGISKNSLHVVTVTLFKLQVVVVQEVSRLSIRGLVLLVVSSSLHVLMAVSSVYGIVCGHCREPTYKCECECEWMNADLLCVVL